MIRPQDIDAAKKNADQLTSLLSGIPPGYIAGYEVSIASSQVFVGPGIANIFGTVITKSQSTQMTEAMWGVTKINSTYYYIYLTKYGEFYIDHLAPSFLANNYGYYHTSLGYRYLGKVFINASGEYLFVLTEGSARAESIEVADLNVAIATVNQYLSITSDGMVGVGNYGTDPAYGDTRSRQDQNEFSIEFYDGTQWVLVAKLGGDESGWLNSDYFPFLQARGVIKTGAVSEVAALDIGHVCPVDFYNFENDYENQDGSDHWDSNLNTVFDSNTLKYGSYALTYDSSETAYLMESNGTWTPGDDFGFAAWVYVDDITSTTRNKIVRAFAGIQEADAPQPWYFDIIQLETRGSSLVGGVTTGHVGGAGSSNDLDATIILSNALSVGWNFVAISWDESENELIVFGNGQYSNLIDSGVWGFSYGENNPSNYTKVYLYDSDKGWIVDDMALGFATPIPTATLTEHYTSGLRWASDIDELNDLVIAPKSGGDVVIVEENIRNTNSLKGHTVVLIADPGTGDLAAKESGWTADSFSGGLDIDCSGEVPSNTKMVLIGISQGGTASNIYVRANGDTAISNAPNTANEYSCRIMRSTDNAWLGWVPVAAGIFQAAVTNTATDLYVSYPRGYMV